MIPERILQAFNLKSGQHHVEPIESGHINKTYKLIGEDSFIIQRINKNVFTKPEQIAANLRAAANHLSANHPDYLFLSSLQTESGEEMAIDHEGFPWRLFPYIPNSVTINEVKSADQAFRAAEAFGALCKKLDGVDVALFAPTILRFHDLNWRVEQFENALDGAAIERKNSASELIMKVGSFSFVQAKYNELIKSKKLIERITHNDTKINNVLFDQSSGEAICVIDLDTLMPGYFLYDLGDMVRTFVPPEGEEGDINRIVFREDIYNALCDGYLSHMDGVLTPEEKSAIPFSGMIMTYIIGLRFLADHLNGDIYFHVNHPGQNLKRAANQFHFLDVLAQKLI